MKTHDRQQRILERLRAEEREWRVEEIAEDVNVSPITVRRDLEALAKQGAVLRTYGGCLYAGRMMKDAGYHRRVSTHYDLKRAIGRKAAQSVRPGESLLLDDGSTCFHVAAQLREVRPLSLYTNSMTVVAELSGQPGVKVILLGGEYDAERQHLGGPPTEWILERLQFDRVFLGADAVDAEGRCLVHSSVVARTAQMMLKRARIKVLLADHTKCGASAHAAYARLSDFDEWITTPGIAPRLRKQVRVTMVKP